MDGGIKARETGPKGQRNVGQRNSAKWIKV